MIFRDYIKERISNENRVVEFGPLTRPIIKKEENPNVSYVDIKCTEDIKKLYSDNIYLKSTGIEVDIDSIVDIDIVVKDNYEKTFRDIPRFDVAILSHVIEHMPDILYFFQDIKNVLKTNGELIIIYPDMRYSFDHYRTDTSFVDAYMTFTKGSQENEKKILDFCMNAVHENDAMFFWNSENISKIVNQSLKDDIIKNYETILNDSTFEDIHYWPFSDFSFLKFLLDSIRFGLIDFKVEEFYPTQENTQEFMVVLKRNDDIAENLASVIEILDKVDVNIIYHKLVNSIETMRADTIKRIKDEYNPVIDNLNHKIENLIETIDNLNKTADS